MNRRLGIRPLKRLSNTSNYLLYTVLTLIALFSASLSAEDKAVVTYIAEPYAELHTGPGRGYPVFYIAERGEAIELLKQRTSWTKVRLLDGNGAGKEGWVKLAAIATTVDTSGQAISVSLPQFDAFANRRWELGFMAGDFGGTDAITGYTGYHFTRNLSVELALTENFGNFSSGESATLNILHQPFPRLALFTFF